MVRPRSAAPVLNKVLLLRDCVAQSEIWNRRHSSSSLERFPKSIISASYAETKVQCWLSFCPGAGLDGLGMVSKDRCYAVSIVRIHSYKDSASYLIWRSYCLFANICFCSGRHKTNWT